jgi:hypothetical protein
LGVYYLYIFIFFGSVLEKTKRQLMHIAPAESIMLQNALMWKVERERGREGGREGGRDRNSAKL